MNHPFKNKLKFDLIDFQALDNQTLISSIEEGLNQARKNLAQLLTIKEPSFHNVILALEFLAHDMERSSRTFFNILSANTNDELQNSAEKVNAKLVEFNSDLILNDELFTLVKKVYDQELSKLSGEDKTLLVKTYKNFTRNGALLTANQKKTLRQIDQELASLSLKFADNLLKEVNNYELWIQNESDLDGLPLQSKETAKEEATKKGRAHEWLFTLQATSVIPFLTYVHKRDLREKYYKAYQSKCFTGHYSNQEIVKKSVELRIKRAQLLGYKHHAQYVLEERMAQNLEEVNAFLDKIKKRALIKANEEINSLRELMKQIYPNEEMKPWDQAYLSEILKKKLYALDEEELRPYFSLEKVIEGVFLVAEKLFGLTFEADNTIPTYQADVKAYRVLNKANKEMLAIFYADFFPRESKRGGAWMTSFQDHYYDENGVKHLPQISIVCNFTKPTQSTPSLLTLEEVKTLFHEFGHALHGMLSTCRHKSLSGTNVYWDFVELPSQIMENWCVEAECLSLFAHHYQTGEVIPTELINKVIEAEKFQGGLATLRQIQFATLDMAWHSLEKMTSLSVEAFEDQVLAPLRVINKVPATNNSCAFSHIFDGEYSSGYYSYKWAEVLDADAFSYFKEKGIFNHEVALKFRKHILEKGGSEHPMVLYKNFRGQEPSVDSLLIRSGI